MNKKQEFLNYLNRMKRHPKTIQSYERAFKFIPSRPRPHDVLAALNQQSNPGTKRLTYALIRRYCAWLRLDPNPTDGIKVDPAPIRTRYLTEEEAFRMIMCAKQIHLEVADFIRVGLATGLRRKALVSLRWKDIDFKARLIWYTKKGTKGQDSVPMSRQAYAILRRKHDDQTNGDRPNAKVWQHSDTWLNVKFREAAKQAGVEGVSIHTMRHTLATRLVQADVPLYDVQQILGHSSSVTTQRYAHLGNDRKRRALDKLDQQSWG